MLEPVFKDTHSTLDHSFQWSSIPTATPTHQVQQYTQDEVREQCQHNEELRTMINKDTVQIALQPSTTSDIQQNRKSGRSSKPPIWLKDFVSVKIHKK